MILRPRGVNIKKILLNPGLLQHGSWVYGLSPPGNTQYLFWRYQSPNKAWQSEQDFMHGAAGPWFGF